MRIPCFLAISVLLSGCAAPAAFTAASLAVDTGSYMMSGKTLTDHGLSLAVQEDCSMMRILDEDDEICREDRDYEVAVAVLTPLPHDRSLDIALASGDEPLESLQPLEPADEGVRVAEDLAQLAKRAHKARTDKPRYLAAGMIQPSL